MKKRAPNFWSKSKTIIIIPILVSAYAVLRVVNIFYRLGMWEEREGSDSGF